MKWTILVSSQSKMCRRKACSGWYLGQIGNLLLPPEKVRVFKCPMGSRDRQVSDSLSQGREKESPGLLPLYHTGNEEPFFFILGLLP
ncbi:hypothetical protein TNCV_4820591 [Trichonephila clavipes]|nr:hypothetical protein TNCV_4820591 [Trichonephila clavipes]